MSFPRYHNKRGDLLLGEVIFLIVAIAFITILMVFIVKKSSAEIIVEENAAKKIALALDAAKPGTEMVMRVKEILDKKDAYYEGEMIMIDNARKIVRVQLSEDSGYSYGYFNAADVESKIIGGENLFLKIK